MPSLVIDFVADVVCPWCYIGWRRLGTALAQRPDVQAQVRWRPFQLTPEMPEEGMDRSAYMAERFSDPERARTAGQAIQAEAARDGLELRLSEIPRSPNTNAAHRLIRWAGGQGLGAQAAEAVLRAYFIELRDIGDPEVLADIGGEIGMDRLLVLRLLAEGADARAVFRDYLTAVQAGITGVPFTVFGGKLSVAGAESPERLVEAVDRALAA